ncbi:ABC transporter ATP-binding protein [Sinorhizobium sp. BG8]|nr:ABC transporter ATP-binding protein [Sinorhizobium sp. BG8]
MSARLIGFVWNVSGRHQIGVILISVLLFSIGTVPLELQRRIINIATEGGPFGMIALLTIVYGVLVVGEGLTKLLLNIYRNWISESATRWLRLHIFETARCIEDHPRPGFGEGVQLSIIVAEAEPIGSFVGDSLSQSCLQIGILCAVTGYLIYLQPMMALVTMVVFVPQLVFVPIIQGAINYRVVNKTSTMRDVSEGIVAAGGAFDSDGAQQMRVSTIFSISMGIYMLKFVMNFLMNLMSQIGYIGIFALGGYFVVKGKTEIGTVVAFVSGLGKIKDPWDDLVDWYRMLKITEAKYELVRKVTDANVPVASREEAASALELPQ